MPKPAVRSNSNISPVSQFFSRIREAWAAGLQYNGTRDMYNTFGWKKALVHEDFLSKYDRQDIAGRIIDSYPDATWSDPPRVTGGDAFDAVWKELTSPDAPVAMFAALNELDKLAGLGQFAIMVVGYDDGADLSQPVNNTKPGRKLIYLQPYVEGAVQIKEYERRQNDPRFGMPTLYSVSPGQFGIDGLIGRVSTTALSGTFNVHASRVLHVAEGVRGSRVFGRSRLEGVYNILDDLMKVTGGAAETFWLAGNRGLHIDVDKDMQLSPEAEDDLSAEVEEYASQLRRIIRTRGVEVKALGSDVADPRGIFDVLLSLLSARTGMPKRILAGSEAGQLASSQDRAEWACRVAERIARHTEPYIFIPFLAMLIQAGVLPQPKDIDVDWSDAYKMSPLERAQTSAQMARSAVNLQKAIATLVPLGDGSTDVAPLFTIDEARQIVGFGKHQPKFDNPSKTSAPPAQPGGDGTSTGDGNNFNA